MEDKRNKTLKSVCVKDKKGDLVFLCFKDEFGHLINGYFELCDDLDSQINFLKVKTKGNVLMIPHDRILKIKLKEVKNGH